MSETTYSFQTEAKQLLHLMIHSLYSNREIFLRELISNASDAIDKLRFEAIADPSLTTDDPEYRIRVSFDAEAKTLTVSDNGVGMTQAEAIEHLGTIAKSGTAEFLAGLTGDQQKDAALIGQFGVGFYSAFIVAAEVEVITRKAGEDAAVRWRSAGESEFTIDDAEKSGRGTDVILHLRDDATEFADGFRLRNIVRRYSDHIGVPVEMPKQGDDEEGWECVNSAQALWTRSRTDVADEEYKEFYKHVSHDFDDPLVWSHNKVEGKLEYTSLLYLPRHAPFDLWNRDAPRGLKLYVQRVFIMDDAEQFLPLYLRFVKGVVDCNDLPLNISRELLQEDERVASIKAALTKRTLDMLAKLARAEGDDYQTFWNEFGQVLKEGPAEDFQNSGAVAKLLRFATTNADEATQNVSLDEYVSRMVDGQDKIYYLAAETYDLARRSPQLEVFKKRGVEVVLLYDRVDEWLMSALGEFEGKTLTDITRGELDLPGADEEQEDAADETSEGLTERLKTVLGDQVGEVRKSQRLTDSPACLVLGDQDMGTQMRRIMEAAGQAVPETAPHLEINPSHPLIKRLDAEPIEDRFEQLTLLLFDQASLADGRQLKDPGAYVERTNQLLVELLGQEDDT